MFSPIHLYRLANWCYRRGWIVPSKLLKFLNFMVFKAVIPYEAQIAADVIIMHQGVGLVIHPNTTIHRGAKIFHNVTLATDVPRVSKARIVVGEGCVIYPNSVIVGPRSIGAGTIVGAGSIVTRDLPPACVAFGNPARVKSQS